MLRRITLAALARRFFSAVSMATNWLRRITSASSAKACSSFRGLTGGLTASPKASQHLGIESVSLGRPSGSAGKLSDLSGIDHRDRNSDGRQRPGHWPFQTAGGFRGLPSRLQV